MAEGRPSPLRRFLDNLVPTENGCVEWGGYRYPKGYGKFYERFHNDPQGPKSYRAHRYAYIAFVGEIQDGLFVCHTCDNPSCCNPDHLWLGTALDNFKDSVEKGRRKNGAPNIKLSENDVISIRKLISTGIQNKEIARMYSVSPNTITNIKLGRSWRHVKNS